MVIDDSGSMQTEDGHVLMGSGRLSRSVSCSRWTELGAAIKFHANLAFSARTPTEFRFLNRGTPLLLGAAGDEGERARLQQINTFLSQSPSGGTPLCRHIDEVVAKVRQLEPMLRQAGQRAVIVIFTVRAALSFAHSSLSVFIIVIVL